MPSLICLVFISHIVLITVNIFLHSAGIHVLRGLCVHTKGGVHMVYIMNLSAVELVMNVIALLSTIILAIPIDLIGDRAILYIQIVEYSVLKFNLYMTIFFITVDRLYLALSSTYLQDCDFRKTRLILAGTWSMSYLICALIAIYYAFTEGGEYFPIIATHTLNLSNIAFLLIAAISLGVVFQKLKIKGRQVYEDQSYRDMFRNSRFYIAFLIITSFLAFTVVPDFVAYFCRRWTSKKMLETSVRFFHAVSNCSHACIYLFVHERIRNHFVRLIKCLTMCCRGSKARSYYYDARFSVHQRSKRLELREMNRNEYLINAANVNVVEDTSTMEKEEL